jgi:4-coumarate--CoA ligase (photoactive yellow protein activation family)
MVASAQWWQHEASLRRFVGHLLRAELTRLRPLLPWPPAGTDSDVALDLPLRPLAPDSLDIMALSVALAAALDLPANDAARLPLVPECFADWLAACRAGLAAQPDAASLRFRSSGSTGAAREHRHLLASLVEEAQFLAACVGTRDRILSAVPAHHIYGFLFTILLPRALGGLPVVELAGPADLVARWQSGDLVIGFPEFWQGVVRLDPQPPEEICGVTSTAPCPAETAIGLAALGLRLIEIFGASDTGGLGWREDPDAPFRWFPWWQHGAEQTVSRVTAGAGACHYALPDQLEAVGVDGFRPRGRRDGVVQVGGVNVDPMLVRAHLCRHPQVGDAAVRLMRPHEGQRLKAFIVPRLERADAAGETALRTALAAWISEGLSPAERPVALRFGAVLPLGPMGKAADWDA